MDKLCRICLSTDKKLEEMNDHLFEYFHDICDYSSGFLQHKCCSDCKELLKDHLDFRNRCLKANDILQEWKKSRSRKSTTIESLHKLLQNSLNDTKNEDYQFKCATNSKNNDKFQDIDSNKEIKVEIKDEVENDFINCGIDNEDKIDQPIDKVDNDFINCGIDNEDTFDQPIDKVDNDFINCGIDNEDTFDQPIDKVDNDFINCGIDNEDTFDQPIDKVDNDFINCGIDNEDTFDQPIDKVERLDQKNHGSDLDSDDNIIMESASKSRKGNQKSKVKKKSQIHIENIKKRVYPRKQLREYLQYAEVFDIQLFSTDEEARGELLSRRVSEPYISATYRCEECYTVYKCNKLLQFHMKWHTGAGQYICDICSMRFGVRKSLQCHKSKCHRGRFTCKLCPLITYYGSAMKAHYQKHSGKTFNCHCGRVFIHISSYLSHKRTVHASSHVCVTCARTFVSELGLINHRLRAHKTKSIVDEEGTARCDPCGLTFVSEQVYNIHILNTSAHREQAKHIIGCHYCGLSFEDASQLKLHKRMKHPVKDGTYDVIKCKLCDAEGVGRSWRRRHYSATHPNTRYLDEVTDARLVMCERCGKRFTNSSLMKDHLNMHLGVKPYACGKCRATFSSKAARQAHVARHVTRDDVQDTRRRRRAKSVSTEVTS